MPNESHKLADKMKHRIKYLRNQHRQNRIQFDTQSSSDGDETQIECSSVTGELLYESQDWDVSSVSDEGSDVHYNATSSDESDGSLELGFTMETDSHPVEEKLFDGCNLSKKNSLSLVSTLSSRFKLSKQATASIVNLISLHLPSNTTYPTTHKTYEKQLKFDNSWYKRLYYCTKCKATLSTNYSCSKCGQSHVKSELDCHEKYFVVFDLQKQLEVILLKPKIRRALESYFNSAQGIQISGITTTSKYRAIQKDLYDISCTFNSDQVFCLCGWCS